MSGEGGWKIVRLVECIEPFVDGVNHYDTWVVECSDGKYRVACRIGTPWPNGPRPTEVIFWGPWKVYDPGFDTPEEAREWWFRRGDGDEEVE